MALLKTIIIPSVFVLFFLFTECMAQCTIKSDSVVCADDFLGFSVVINGQANSYAWQLGDGKTSVLADPIAQYSTFGIKNIQVTVQLKSGGTCTASKTIFVHDRPVARLAFSSQSQYCFSANNVCVMDLSGPGQTGSSPAKRSILFGDGYADLSNNPVGQPTACYSYPAPGVYPIVMEITDVKGCYARDHDTVQIFHNASASFTYNLNDKCDNIELCLANTSQLKRSEVQSFYWNYGDGTIDSVNWNPRCHSYHVQGKYSVSFVVRTGPDCIDTLLYPALIDLNPNPIVKDIPITSGCLGTTFPMADIGNSKDHYTWFISYWGLPYDSISNSSSTTFTPDEIGDYYVKLKVVHGNCKKEIVLDTLEVNGPKARIATRNGALCVVGDTTYFCDASDYTNTHGVRRLWYFDDPVAPSCTTDTDNGLNVGINCNYSLDVSPKHYYSFDSCYQARLELLDTVTLCQSIGHKSVLIGREDPANTALSVVNDKACTGEERDRRHYFFVQTCGDYMIMPDSAGSAGFITNLLFWNYDTLTHPDGYITIGLILLTSDTNSGCPGFSSGPPCHDTLWYHHKLQLIEKPRPAFQAHKMHFCQNEPGLFSLNDSSDTHISKVSWYWGDGDQTTLNLSPGQPLPGTYAHSYPANGPYHVQVVMENINGCVEQDTLNIEIGHHGGVVFPETICAGQCITFDETIRYYSDTVAYWDTVSRRAAGKESVRWTWSTGTPDSIPSPTRCFPQPGVYTVIRTSTDSTGCVVTEAHSIPVGGVKAGIRYHKGEILCSEIVQLFDSSSVISPSTGETIMDYTWDFSDGTPVKKVKDPYHFYSAFGTFTITLRVESSMGCADSTQTKLKIIGPEPSFEFVTDTIGCVPLTVEMKNISHLCSHWIWYFGDPANNTLPTKYDSNVIFTYNQPGTYYLKLYGADSIYNMATNNKQFCSATYPDLGVPGQIEKKVIVLPRPPVDFAMPAKICVDQRFTLVSLADPAYSLHQWDLGNGTTYSTGFLTHQMAYPDAGTYQVKYTPTFPPDPSHGKACYDSAVKTIEVVDVKADFDINPNRSGPLHFQFVNKSMNAVSYYWTFTGLDSVYSGSSKERDPYHSFYPNQGRFRVCLTVWNELGCPDTLCQTFDLTHPKYLFIPNVFTPADKDGLNDAFDIEIVGEEKYHLLIYNRYGDMVFEGHQDGVLNDGINWNGNRDGDYVLPAGVYYVVFHYNFYYEQPVKYTGTVTIIR